MPKILLRSNRRFAALGLGLAFLGLAMAIWMLVVSQATWLRGVGALLALSFTIVAVFAWRFWQTPRLALTGDELLVFVRTWPTIFRASPYHVPLDNVEVFFMGQGAVSGIEPGHPREYEGAVAANVVVRLAEAQKSWHARDINQWLGVWAEGYITLRGLWCENIDQDLLKDMNHNLMAAKRERRAQNERAESP